MSGITVWRGMDSFGRRFEKNTPCLRLPPCCQSSFMRIAISCLPLMFAKTWPYFPAKANSHSLERPFVAGVGSGTRMTTTPRVFRSSSIKPRRCASLRCRTIASASWVRASSILSAYADVPNSSQIPTQTAPSGKNLALTAAVWRGTPSSIRTRPSCARYSPIALPLLSIYVSPRSNRAMVAGVSQFLAVVKVFPWVQCTIAVLCVSKSYATLLTDTLDSVATACAWSTTTESIA